MILACYILLKAVLFFVIMRPWSLLNPLLEGKCNLGNLMNVGSVMYHIVLDLLDELVPIAEPSKFKPIFKQGPSQFYAIDGGKEGLLEVVPDPRATTKNEVIHGFYSRNQVSEFLDQRPLLANRVKGSVMDFLEIVYGMSHKARKNNVPLKFKLLSGK